MSNSTPSLGAGGRGLAPMAAPDLPSPDYIATPVFEGGQQRRSIKSLTILRSSGLKTAKGKLQKLWPASKSPASPSELSDWTKCDLSAVIGLAGFQMGALGSPANAMSPARNDDHEAPEPLAIMPPTRPPPPPPPLACARHPPPSFPNRHSVPLPEREPPPPPRRTSELFSVHHDENQSEIAVAGPPARPVSPPRRRAKTPVYQIGQLERAAKHSPQQSDTGLNRMSSVSTIARQYRELVHYPDVPDDDADADAELDATSGLGHEISDRSPPTEHRHSTSAGSGYDPRRCSRLAPSFLSDDGTLVALEEELVEDEPRDKSTAWSPLPPHKGDDGDMASPRFRVGLDLLTRELSSAMATHSEREGRDAAGLQVLVMIEAYERLRRHVAATGQGGDKANEAIDSWLEALHAIHRGLADETATGGSEYGD